MNLERIVRLLGLRYVTAALVLLALAALYGAASLSRPEATAEAFGSGVDDPLASAVSVCPGRENARLSVQGASPNLLKVKARTPGRADVVQTPNGLGVGSLTTPGGLWTKDLSDVKDSYTVRASGAMAAGLEAEQTTHWPKGDDRGLAGLRCARPGTDLWFLGPGPTAAESIDVHLTNVDAEPAAVDITALSGEGPLDTPDGRGIPVPPYSTKVVSLGKSPEGLGEIVKTASDLSLRVRATTGRIAASVRVRIGDGKGVEWLPVSPGPAASLIVPGLPGGNGRRSLLVAVPGQEDAAIRLQVITSTGTFAPQGQDTLDAPAGTVTTLDLDRALTGKPAAVRLLSDRPIVAGFSAQRGADIAYGTSTPPLTPGGFGVVSDNRFDTTIALTAPRGDATVRITPLGPQSTPKTIKVPSDRTVEVKLTAAEKGYGVVIVPQPGSGPVHAVRTLSTGKGDTALITALPINPARTTVHLPPVGDTQTAITP
ncbi:hypothetical protein Acsp03_13560 [Actinomadura sp. NBRC 104412]|uniref:DUF5719 family protein n=1 Tax=Actinomadura sp. NBRC 104412 TaxID=3032203 RepID=UPI0024A04412|nr:DUF5719 family protein [Actinomadura sp. NBRC 104412]GLZ03890.1 hypothetical protein Acsp03_13560 [Actinomadura sp. NBRC 104412]